MRIFLLTALLLLSVMSWGNNYYFSVATGDDSRSAQEAQNPETPWKSIDKLNAFSRGLQPGDSVLFKRGEVFYGSITIRARGAMNNPIYYGAWGAGELP